MTTNSPQSNPQLTVTVTDSQGKVVTSVQADSYLLVHQSNGSPGVEGNVTTEKASFMLLKALFAFILSK